MRRVILILIAPLLIAGGIYFLITSGKIPNPFKKDTSLGGQIFRKVQNPLQGKMPPVDTFGVKTNFFKDIYPNPFGEKK